jgi:hypothetical protein
MATAAHDYDIVLILRLRIAPCGRPSLIALESLRKQRENRVFHLRVSEPGAEKALVNFTETGIGI